MIVPFTPGGSQDVIARLFAQKLTESMKQQVVIDNRGGAAGLIAAELVARAPKDGYTIFLITGGPISLAPALHPQLPYDPVKDFAPITQLVDTAMALIVTPGLPVKNVPDLVALSKAKPLNYGSTGNGSISHLTMEALKHATGINVTHVPYKGAAPAMIDMLAGEGSVMFHFNPSAPPYRHCGPRCMRSGRSQKRCGSD